MATNDWVKGALVGGIVGIVIGVLFAPKSGKRHRGDLRQLLGGLLDKAEHSYEEAVTELDELVADGSAAYEDKKERLRRAFDAALAAYKAEKETASEPATPVA